MAIDKVHMTPTIENYLEQQARLPRAGRHVVASFDADTVVVYQAYRAEIADHAVHHQRFGGPWSFTRMSWIKPGFMWMMYRSGWATKPGQERVLAVTLRRAPFETLVNSAVLSHYVEGVHPSRESWKEDAALSDVRVQWDPDHSPKGGKLERRAIQLGLRGDALRRYAVEWVVSIADVTPFVHEQYGVLQRDGVAALRVPREDVLSIAQLTEQEVQ